MIINFLSPCVADHYNIAPPLLTASCWIPSGPWAFQRDGEGGWRVFPAFNWIFVLNQTGMSWCVVNSQCNLPATSTYKICGTSLDRGKEVEIRYWPYCSRTQSGFSKSRLVSILLMADPPPHPTVTYAAERTDDFVWVHRFEIKINQSPRVAEATWATRAPRAWDRELSSPCLR